VIRDADGEDDPVAAERSETRGEAIAVAGGRMVPRDGAGLIEDRRAARGA
jgi:hypothetical protein